MLKIGQLAQIKSDSPYVYEALTQLVNGVNAVGRATGVDPSGSHRRAVADRQPERHRRRRNFRSGHHRQFHAQSRHFLFRGVGHDARFQRSPTCIFSAARATCASRWATRRSTGAPTRNISARKLPQPVTFGSPPTAVTGGGTAAGPALQPSSGSGTASGSEGGSGFGQVAQSSSGPVILR